MNHYFGPGYRSGYGYYGRDLGRAIGYGGLAMSAFQMLDQSSINNRLVNNQISATNRTISMAEKEQDFRHSQVLAQAQAQRETVLVTRGPIVYQLPVVHQVEKESKEVQETKELQQKIKILELELEKLKLQQELEKAKK